MMQSGAIKEGSVHESPAISAPKPVTQAPATPVHDLNVPYEATEEYDNPPNMAYPQVLNQRISHSCETVLFITWWFLLVFVFHIMPLARVELLIVLRSSVVQFPCCGR